MSIFDTPNRDLAIIKQLTNIPTERTVPESIFRKNFAPLFFGKITDKETYEDILSKWLAISGSPTNEVIVVDDNDKVLFSVPPAMDTAGVMQKDREKGELPVTSVLGMYSESKNISINSAENFMDRATREYIPTLVTERTEKTVTYLSRWEEIRERYYPNEVKTAEKPKVSQKPSYDEIELDVPE